MAWFATASGKRRRSPRFSDAAIQFSLPLKNLFGLAFRQIFMLSWSLLEALACGCQVIASDMAPVREVIRDGENGFLVDFFDKEALVGRALEVLANKKNDFRQREIASQGVHMHYSVVQSIGRYLEEINKLLDEHLIIRTKGVADFNIG